MATVSFHNQMFTSSTISPFIAGGIRIFSTTLVRSKRKAFLSGKIIYRLRVVGIQCRIKVVTLILPTHIKFQKQRPIMGVFERSLPGIDYSRRDQFHCTVLTNPNSLTARFSLSYQCHRNGDKKRQSFEEFISSFPRKKMEDEVSMVLHLVLYCMVISGSGITNILIRR